MLRIIVEFLTKVSLRIEIKLVKLLQQEQGLILDEFSHVQGSFLLFRHKGPQSVSAQCKTCLFSASSLTQSLRSSRSTAASGRDTQKNHRYHQEEKSLWKRPRRCRFSIGSAPLTSITESDAQISGGETRQDFKDTRRFPLVAPSCALLFLPFGLPVSFRCYGRVYLIPRLTLSSGKAVRSKLDCMHEPPVQSDCCALSGNYRLESNPERHAKAPLAAATGN